MLAATTPARAHLRRCDLRPSYNLCAIHHWRDQTHHVQRLLGAPRTRYGWTADRPTASAAYRAWVRHLWYTRYRAWRHQLAPWPSWWLSQAECIHQHEGAWNSQTGNGYLGGFQFLPSTWAAHGGLRMGSNPALLEPVQQLHVAYNTWVDDGGSWREWGTAPLCGLG